jgi:5-carboxymethyl-2-hydroxymuconate isomerase
MKLATFTIDGRQTWGAIVDKGVIDLGARLEERYPRLIDLVAHQAISAAADMAAVCEPDYALTDITFLPPILCPEKIICIGVNYGDRNAEYKDGSEAPKYPSVFLRTPDSLVGHDHPILRPPESEQFDYEGEIAIIIGKTGRRIPEADAESHIAGLTCLNEGSVRDWLRHGKFNVTQGKNFVASGSVGPWMVTADEFDDYDDLEVTTRVNDEVRQHDTTANLMFPFRYLISYLSTFMILKPGDIISTGTPIGAGIRFDPPKFLKPGDVVEVEASGIGILRNSVEDEVVAS